MTLVEWSDDLSVGQAEIDADHRKLFDLVNYLYNAMQPGRDGRLVDGFVEALVVYVREHFAEEERCFDETAYPDRAAHMAEHRRLIRQIFEARDEYKSGDPAKSLEMIGFINQWLIEHIRTTDMKYLPHLKARGAG